MQDKAMTPFVLLSVPMSVLKEADISENDVVQIIPLNGRIVIQAIRDSGDFICDGDCAVCPMSEFDCDGDCENCPCYDRCDEKEGD